MHAPLLSACTIVLALHLGAGTRIVEHGSYDDRIAWLLPSERLAAFRHGGFVIDEERRITFAGDAVVSGVRAGMQDIAGTMELTSVDVPRHHVDRSTRSFHTTLTERNQPVPRQRLDIESAAMYDFPQKPMCIGQSWLTRVAVTTALGSGTASITHTIAAVNGALVQIDVRASGAITGAEYNLPGLLPGSIALRGRAWFDRSAGLVTRETYVIHNRLAKTKKGKTIGFDETETVDAGARRAPPR